MTRREFITLLGGAAAWPLVARAQQAMPVIGFLFSRSDPFADRLRAFRQGLKETGYVEGENVAIEYRWAENRTDRLPALLADLIRRRVTVITAMNAAGAVAAKAASTTIPIVFLTAETPVRLGLVASLARPGGNLTGIFFNVELVAKRLALLRELVPGASRVAVLLNPSNAASLERTRSKTAARDMGLQIQFLNASTSRQLDAAFTALVRERVDALFVSQDGFFNSRRVQLANMAARHVVPIISATREIVEAGGLMSYGSNIQDTWRQVGVYTGRILKGEKPIDLPVQQAAKVELIINVKTAKALGLTVPPSLLARADEVIE